MRVLVTGGAGFIGARIIAELRRRGIDAFVLDRRAPADGTPYTQGDVMDGPLVRRLMRDADAVMHLASMISVAATEKNPRGTLDVAVLGTRTVCEAADRGQRIVLASTSEVYGDALVVPTPESAPVSPKGPYGIAKVAAEAYVCTAVRDGAPHFTILRYFSVYGPGQAPDFVVPRFVRQALAGQPLTLYGDGSQVRAFSHVEDVARGSVQALLAPNAAGQTYNIGNPTEPITMAQLAETIIDVTGSTSKTRHVDFAQSDRTAQREIYRRIPDIRRAAHDFSYEPQWMLRDGIQSVQEALQHAA